MQYKKLNKEQLIAEQSLLLAEFAALKEQGLKLDMTRGKPSAEQVSISNDILTDVGADGVYSEDGTDTRNYGGPLGIIEARRLMGELMGVKAEQVIIGGGASLNLMFDVFVRAWIHGVLPGQTPWGQLEKVKFLCPAPGYDRHFAICEYFGIEMITVPLNEDGPDMDMVEELVKTDAAIKGMWCVPQYSNPDGYTYSDAVVKRLAAMETAAADFRIFFDNAYCVHHLYEDEQARLINLYDACAAAGHADRCYIFASMAKITFGGAGISAMAMSPTNFEQQARLLGKQIICYDKVNQLRHARFFADKAAVEAHMMKHAASLRPKFAKVEEVLAESFERGDILKWTKPLGGYFVSVYTMDGCAKRIVELCKEAGVALTKAGATYPYGIDPQDHHIRIAPSFPPVAELDAAMRVFACAVKLASIEKLLAE